MKLARKTPVTGRWAKSAQTLPSIGTRSNLFLSPRSRRSRCWIPNLFRRTAMRHQASFIVVRGLAIAGTLLGVAACAADAPVGARSGLSDVYAAQGNSDTPVTSIVADADSLVAGSLQLRSDGLGTYRNSSTLSSVIQSIGAWVLDSKNPRNSTRRVYLEFSQPVTGSGPNGGDPVAVPSGLYKVRAISKCNLFATSMWAVAPGATISCPLHIAFDYGGSGYAVQMNPYPAGDPEGAPETQPVNITCVVPSSGAGPCTQWKITPSGTSVAADGSVAYRNVARLIKYVSVKNSTTNVNQGDFYLSFSIRVTNP